MQRLAAALTLVLCFTAHYAPACAVPVFRYALERWESDPFQLVVFYKGKLDPALDKQLTDLEPILAENAGARANCKVTRINVDQPVPALWTEVWQKQSTLPLPSAALCTPEWRKGESALWTGEATGKIIDSLVDSPKRRELRAHALKGTAVVWIIVETDDLKKNKALADQVSAASDRLVNEILIPEGIGKDGTDVRSPLPIEVSFATVKVNQDDPNEAILMRLLNNGDKFKEPTLIPTFGRARALAAMSATTVNAGLLEETSRFICGACSCQVKAQNPGFDLLIKADWESIFGDQAAPPPERYSKLPPKPVYVPIPAKK
jgi:hypothetical protein